MDINKEREAFQNFCEQNFDVERHEQTYFDEQTQSYENDLGECTESINMAWMAWQAKAQAVPEGFVLIKDDTKTVVAIERMVEQQVEASGMDSRRLERLDGWKIIEAAVKAQEPVND